MSKRPNEGDESPTKRSKLSPIPMKTVDEGGEDIYHQDLAQNEPSTSRQSNISGSPRSPSKRKRSSSGSRRSSGRISPGSPRTSPPRSVTSNSNRRESSENSFAFIDNTCPPLTRSVVADMVLEETYRLHSQNKIPFHPDLIVCGEAKMFNVRQARSIIKNVVCEREILQQKYFERFLKSKIAEQNEMFSYFRREQTKEDQSPPNPSYLM